MEKAIGGYFELEFDERYDYPHSRAFHLNSGRHALEFILRSREWLPTCIWLPYYTCDSVFQPLKRLNIPYKFYHINSELEIDDYPELNSKELIIVNNYFGLKDRYTEFIGSYYNSQLILDCTQSWYAPELKVCSQFYSPRKFFGMPDGGIACTQPYTSMELEEDHSSERCAHLLKRIDFDSIAGYQDFKLVSQMISELPLRKMSKLSQAILGHINHEKVRHIRKSNYEVLHRELKDINLFNAPDITEFALDGCPMIYPFVSEKSNLRNHLIKHKVFVANYWPGISAWCPDAAYEVKLAENLIPLPIDQRYDARDMERIIEIIKQ